MHHFSPKTYHPSHLLVAMDARVKLLSASALLVMVLSCRESAFPLFVAVVCLTLCLSMRVPVRKLALRFAEPAFIACTIVLLKLFIAGSVPLFTWHFFGMTLVGHSDGALEGARIAARIAGGVSVLAAVGFSSSFTELMAALSWLKVPQGFVDVALFAWRYLFLLLDDAQVVYHAQKNRLGYAGRIRGLRSFGTLAGVLVLKAFDNSQSITTAMVQRGYDGSMPLLRHKPFVAAEVFSSLLFVVGMAAVRSI